MHPITAGDPAQDAQTSAPEGIEIAQQPDAGSAACAFGD